MKKLLLLLISVSAVFHAHGALQYEIVSTPFQDNPNSHHITIKILEGGSLWITTLTGPIHYSYIPAMMNEKYYGWKDMNSGEVFFSDRLTTLFNFTQEAPHIVQPGFFIGNFNFEDEISIWLTAPSLKPVEGWVSPNSNGTRGHFSSEEYVDNFGNQVIFYMSPDYILIPFVLIGGEYVNLPPSGQPLPGALAALLLGGGLGAYRIRKRKSNR